MKKVSGICFLVIGLRKGILAILICKVINECVCAWLNIRYNRELLGYGVCAQLRDMLPPALCSLGMAVAAALVGRLALAPLPLMCLQMLCGICSYALLSLALNMQTMRHLLDILLKR